MTDKQQIKKQIKNTFTVTDEQVELLRALIVVGLFVGGGRLPLLLQGLPDLAVVYPPCNAQRQRKAQDRPFKPSAHVHALLILSHIYRFCAQPSVTFQVINLSVIYIEINVQGKNYYYLTSWR